MPSRASTLKLLRQIHLYFGVFISPAILFFAITGALQTFSLHETTRGSDYKPPPWIVKLGQLHKKQTLVVPARRPQIPAPAAAPAKPADSSAPSASKPAPQLDAAAPKSKSLLPMKLFFLLVSIGLVISTFTGIYMAYKYNRNKSWVTGLLLAGIAIPLLLLLF
jgi:hypothetical protein